MGEAIERQIFPDLPRYREILGAVAVASDGMFIDSTGLSSEDTHLLASLAGSVLAVADPTADHLGTAGTDAVSMTAGDGMLHPRQRDGVTLIVVTERSPVDSVATLNETVIESIVNERGNTS